MHDRAHPKDWGTVESPVECGTLLDAKRVKDERNMIVERSLDYPVPLYGIWFGQLTK